MSGTDLSFRKRIERARMTWQGNRTLVHATRRRSLQLAIRSFFVSPKAVGNQEQRRLKSV